MRRFVQLFLAVTIAVGIGMAEPASAAAGTRSNTAVVVNTKDGASRSRLAFSLLRTKSSEVTLTNIAFAYARCESCRTVAIALQIALVAGRPENVVLQNRATAVNDHCSHCDTLAAAYQFVVVTSGRARLTPQGYRRLAATRHQLGKLARSQLPIQDIQVRVAQLAARVQSILASELVVARSHHAACRSHGSAKTRCMGR